MPWTASTEADVLSEFTPEESAIIQAVQGAVDNLPAVLARVVAQLRDAIRSGGYALSDDETTIPLGQHDEVIAVARWRFIASLPSLPSLATEARKQLYLDALEKWKAIAKQEYAVEPPAAPTTTPSGQWNSERKLVMRTHPIPRPSEQFPNEPSFAANPDAPENL